METMYKIKHVMMVKLWDFDSNFNVSVFIVATESIDQIKLF